VVEPPQRPAVVSQQATHSVLLDAALAGTRLVVVGERGIVLLSDDSGATWRQAKVPVSVTLTAVAFVNVKTGWAVGHYGTVLRTDDGGESWKVQLDGVRAAGLAVASAQERAKSAPADDPKAKALLAEAERLVSDGPDKPFLDLYFESETTGFVVGAYNLIFRTEDGGTSWIPWMDRVDNPKTLHLYAIRPTAGVLYMAGEQGLFLRSTDGGKSFTRVQAPYSGSFFTMSVLPSGAVLAAGLRGNAWVFEGDAWRKVEPTPPVSFTASALGADQTLYLTHFAGQVLASRDGARSFQPLPLPPLPPLTKVLPMKDGFLVLSLQGLIKLPAGPPAAGVPAPQAGGVR
jgi:photosystem II stability/assembly factor-like uncharacterized protein